MNRMKTFGKYLLWVVLFYIFSNILIFFCLNNNYKNLRLKGNTYSQINISTADATIVNGRIRGSVSNTDEIKDKYIKFSFYNDNNNLTGIKYLKVSDLKDNSFSFYFRLQYTDSYSVEIVDEAQVTDSENYEEFFSFEQYRKYEIAYWFLLLLFI